MAVIVEVEEEPPKKADTGKGKGVGAGERSAMFAQYLRDLEQMRVMASGQSLWILRRRNKQRSLQRTS